MTCRVAFKERLRSPTIENKPIRVIVLKQIKFNQQTNHVVSGLLYIE